MAEHDESSGASAETRKVIHDLRQPLAALQMWVELLGESLQGHLGDQQQRYLAKVRGEVARLGTLLERSAQGAPAERSAASRAAEPSAMRSVAPSTSQPSAAAGAPQAAASSAADSERLAGLTLLVVEDDEMTAEALQVALESEGARVMLASTIADGLARFEATPPDAVLSDLRVSDGDGFTLVAEIRRRDRERGRRTAALAVTGFDSPETRAAARDAGFDQTITKPFQLDGLIDAVVRLVAAR
jgi:two-component system, OmpR family, response regulator